MGIPDFGMPPVDPFEADLEYGEKFKKAVLLMAGAAVQKLMQSLAKEQEVLMRIADMMIWTYTAESLVLRVQKLAGQRGEDAVAHEMAMMKVYCYRGGRAHALRRQGGPPRLRRGRRIEGHADGPEALHQNGALQHHRRPPKHRAEAD